MEDTYYLENTCNPVMVINISNLVGGPEISSPNRKSANLRTSIVLDLRTFCKCGNLQICYLRTIKCLQFVDLRFADPNIFCRLKTSATIKF